MAGNKREMHVHRVYQTDAQGNIEDDTVWIDLARIDKLTVSFGADTSGTTGQIVHYVMDWGDEVTPVKGRTYHELKIEQPDSGGAGAGLSIALQLVETATFIMGAWLDGTTGQRIKFAFVNDPNATSKRKVTPVRVINVDVSNAIKFPDVSVGAPPPPSSPYSLINWDEYSRALINGTPDDSQYVDTEVVDSFTVNFPTPPDFSNGNPYQLVKYVLKSDDIEQLFKAPSSSGVVYRIDPFQTIVNVSWGGLLAVEFE
jgi:hypothetical protein